MAAVCLVGRCHQPSREIPGRFYMVVSAPIREVSLSRRYLHFWIFQCQVAPENSVTCSGAGRYNDAP